MMSEVLIAGFSSILTSDILTSAILIATGYLIYLKGASLIFTAFNDERTGF
jgi:hypothetical protein